jgi:signal transduction histidine kinase
MRSITLKLMLAFLIVSLIGVAVMAAMIGLTTTREFRNFIFNQDREALMSALADYYQAHGTLDGVEAALPPRGAGEFVRAPMHTGRGPYTIVDRSGQVLNPGMRHRMGQTLAVDQLPDAFPIEVEDEIVGWLIEDRAAFIANPTETLFIQRTNRALLFGGLGAVGAALLVAVFLSRTLTKPLREVTAATRAVADGDLDQQVPVRTNDELGDLAASFNRMSDQLARAQALREQMTADIAHELRTPISIILGHADAIQDGVMPPSDETFNIIYDEAKRLERMVEELRTLSRADSGELELRCARVSLAELVHGVAAAHRPGMAQQGVNLETEISPGLPDIYIDFDRMTQVLGNLLANALRHTPGGGVVTISASETRDRVQIRVEDTGPGIQPEDLGHLFDRFYRGDKSRQRASGGSGLGLAIAKSIVEIHGGNIRAESTPGEGSAFIIELPQGN